MTPIEASMDSTQITFASCFSVFMVFPLLIEAGRAACLPASGP